MFIGKFKDEKIEPTISKERLEVIKKELEPLIENCNTCYYYFQNYYGCGGNNKMEKCFEYRKK